MECVPVQSKVVKPAVFPHNNHFPLPRIETIFSPSHLVFLFSLSQPPPLIDLRNPFHQYWMQYHRSASIIDLINFRPFDAIHRSYMIGSNYSPVSSASHFLFRAPCCEVSRRYTSTSPPNNHLTTIKCLLDTPQHRFLRCSFPSNDIICSYRTIAIF